MRLIKIVQFITSLGIVLTLFTPLILIDGVEVNETITVYIEGEDTQCVDGIDNDSDGQIDFPADSGCDGVNDDDESDDPEPEPEPDPEPAPSPGGGGPPVGLIERIGDIVGLGPDVITDEEPEPLPEEEAVMCLLMTDFNEDNAVNIVDLSILLYYAHEGESNERFSRHDINDDGIIDLVDISILFYCWR